MLRFLISAWRREDQILRFSVERTPMALRATFENVRDRSECQDTTYFMYLQLVRIGYDSPKVSMDFTFSQERPVFLVQDIKPVFEYRVRL